MTRTERQKLEVMKRLERGELSRSQAAGLLDLSERQVYRLFDRFRSQGDAGVIHRSRGGHSARRSSPTLRTQVLRLFQESYHDYAPTLFSEVLHSDHGIRLHRETIRRWAIEEGLWKRPERGRRSRKHRKARPRRTAFGAMIQLDGSEHDWFEGRNPDLLRTTLLVMIDDATNMVMLRFAGEHTTGVFGMLRDYILRFGVPQAIYTDHGAVYGVKAEDKTQYRRALRELGILPIQAHSPQAKGRVERCNRTLQDRLVKAMRRENISTIEQANQFLHETYTKVFNKHFARGFEELK